MYWLTEVGIFKADFSPIEQVPAAASEGSAGELIKLVPFLAVAVTRSQSTPKAARGSAVRLKIPKDENW